MLAILGCGNANRSDDGVGVVVAQRLLEALRDRPADGVAVFDCGTAGMEVMFRARGAERLVVVDACRSGSEPGAVFRVPGAEVAQAHTPAFTLHDFRWDHALAAGRRIFGDAFPSDVEAVLVEAETLELGVGLSAPVAAAAARVTAELLAEIDAWRARPAPPGERPVRFRGGTLHLDAAEHGRFFAGRDTVVAVVRDGRLLVLPVHDASLGGLLLKVRNAKGDRVVHLQEVLRASGLDEQLDAECDARWDGAEAALCVDLPVPGEAAR